jgi:hypothetical protein
MFEIAFIGGIGIVFWCFYRKNKKDSVATKNIKETSIGSANISDYKESAK